jgi:hypothetical protein
MFGEGSMQTKGEHDRDIWHYFVKDQWVLHKTILGVFQSYAMLIVILGFVIARIIGIYA